MKKLLLIFLILSFSHAFSQDWPVKRLITERLNRNASFLSIPAFQFVGNRAMESLGTYQEVQLSKTFITKLMTQKPEAIQITVPISNSQSITCQLVKSDMGNIKFTENDNQIISNIRMPVAYHGIVVGKQEKNSVILTVNDDYISLVAVAADRTLQITKADATNPFTYRLYNSTLIRLPAATFDCGTKESYPSQTPNGISLNGVVNRTDTLRNKCVNVFVDCFDSLFQWRGSSQQQTVNYVIELFNLVATGYLNDSINTRLIGINIWTSQDPYRQDTKANALEDLGSHYKDNFWGNICVGLDYTVGLGGLAWVAKAKAVLPNTCPMYESNQSSGAFSYCDLNFDGNLQNFPTGPNATQGQVAVMMHEMGHQLGAHHTHWCGWQLTSSTTGAIDNCAPVEGSCMPGPPPTAAGGSIMSYCHLATNNSFIDYRNGFGTLPGNAIRNFVDQTSCISNCVNCTTFLRPQPQKSKQRFAREQSLLSQNRPFTFSTALLHHTALAPVPVVRKQPIFVSF